MGCVPSFCKAMEMHITQAPNSRPPIDVDAMSKRLPLYQPRMRLPLYNCAVNVFTASNDRDAGKVVIHLFPDLGADAHAQVAEEHRLAHEVLLAAYNVEVDAAFMRNVGRLPTVGDYKVSAVWRDEFPEDDKDLLRGLAHRAYEHRDVSRAHAVAAASVRRRRRRS